MHAILVYIIRQDRSLRKKGGTEMRIDNRILRALKDAVAEAGDAKEFAAKCRVSASNISRYLSGKVKSVSDECWERMAPFLTPAPARHAAGTIGNTPELRAFIRQAMERCGMTTPLQLCRAIGYGHVETFRRLFDGELNWFPDVLSAVFGVLECDPESSPLSKEERSLLADEGLYREGAMLVRPVPVEAQRQKDKLAVDGILDITLIYQTDDSAIPVSIRQEEPFHILFDTQALPEDHLSRGAATIRGCSTS